MTSLVASTGWVREDRLLPSARRLTNLRRNLLMTVAAISTVAISLLLLGGVQILGMVVNNVTLNWEAKVEVSVFLRDDIRPERARPADSQTSRAMTRSRNVTYVSKEEAFEEFKRALPEPARVLREPAEDALPASLRIKLTDAKFTEEVADAHRRRARRRRDPLRWRDHQTTATGQLVAANDHVRSCR